MSKVVFKGRTRGGISYIIRYPKKSDLHEFWRYINQISEEKTFVSIQGEKISLKEENKWLKTQLTNINNKVAIQLLVEIEGKIAGVSGVNMSKNAGAHVGVFGITIAKDSRHQGIGKILMGSVLKEAKSNIPQLKMLVLGVFSNNLVAKKMYEGFGFKEYGRLPKGILHQGKYIDDVKMYYEIKS